MSSNTDTYVGLNIRRQDNKPFYEDPESHSRVDCQEYKNLVTGKRQLSESFFAHPYLIPYHIRISSTSNKFGLKCHAFQTKINCISMFTEPTEGRFDTRNIHKNRPGVNNIE